ncbi:MAG: dTDP-4-dehydrorhamnose 3,5-epimerase [bacterium]|nr:dTDP-4-dehydrorhamnose 3,5-epimerase [bacterium]
MKITATKLKGLYIIQPEVKKDNRGFFMEVFRKDIFKENGLDLNFVQINHSCSTRNILRGLHFQFDKPLGKLIRVINGEAFAVVVDIRKKSETFKEWFGIRLSAENKTEIYAPAGFATGLCVLSDTAEVEYQFTELYNPQGEANIIWDDKDINIAWPINNPIISKRDKSAQTLEEWLKTAESELF